MTEHEFIEIVIPLENMFEKLEISKENEYYKIFLNYPIYILKDAVRWLIRNHTYKRFPLPAEIIDATREMDKERSFASAEDLDYLGPKCVKCGGTGWQTIEREEPLYPNEKKRDLKHEFSVFCSCPKGVLMGRAHKKEIEEARGQKEREINPPIEYPQEFDEV